MSYTILYRSMFVRVADNKFIPMIEMGDNNVYEGRGRYERRSREWQNWRINKPGFAFTREEIMADVYAMIKDYKDRYVNRKKNIYDENCNEYYTFDEVSKNFGYFAALSVGSKSTSNTSERTLINFFNKGFEQAVDFSDEDCTIKIIEKGQPTCHVSTYEDLVEYTKGKEKGVYLEYGPGVEWLWREHKTKREKAEPKEHTEGYVIGYKSNYVNKITRTRLFPVHNMLYAHVYTTENAAKRVMNRILAGWQCTPEEVELIKVKKNAETNNWER